MKRLTNRANQSLPVWAAWLAGACLATAMLAGACLFGDLRYANNDDTYLLRAMMGYAPGGLPTFNMCLQAPLLYPLRWLATGFPGVAWFSYLQLALLWLASTVVVKSLMLRFARMGHSAWLGLGAGLLFLVVYAVTYCCRVTFTVTAGLLGAAAVAQTLNVDTREGSGGQIMRGMGLALLLAVLAYSLRPVTALPILAFCGLGFVVVGAEGMGQRRACIKPLALSAAMVAVVFGALVGLRAVEVKAQGMGDYLAWQDASAAVMDYTGLGDLPDELLHEIGWSKNELALVNDWYFMDENITVEAFDKIAAFQAAQTHERMGARLSRGMGLLTQFGQKEPLATRSLWILAAVAALCALGLCLRKERRMPGVLGLCAGVPLTAGLLLYLAVQGRLPLRAVMMTALPAAGLCFGLLPACLPCEKSRGRRWMVGLAACACVALAAWYAVPAMRALAPAPVTEEMETVNAYADMDEFALDNPELLLIADSTLVGDLRMFPDTSMGIPTNLLYWGGWGARSAEYMAQLAAFGIDGAAMDATIFLRDDVRLLRGMLDPPPMLLYNYLNEKVAADYMPDVDWGGIHSFCFYSLE
ncbi:MAG: hypothetical protein RR367_05855 [Clostridia bacterium]